MVANCVGARNLRDFICLTFAIFLLQVIFLRLSCLFATRLLQKMQMGAPSGLRAIWEALPLAPGTMLLALLQVCTSGLIADRCVRQHPIVCVKLF